jgi:hypothetical protein
LRIPISGRPRPRRALSRWSEITSTGFGYHAVIVAWRSRSGRLLGVRTHAVDRFVCQTRVACTTGPQWIWLGDVG